METKIFLSALVLLIVATGSVECRETRDIHQGFRDVVDDTGRAKRGTSDLQDFREALLELLNQYRASKNLPLFVSDATLENGAQEWAESEGRAFAMTHSCDVCPDFSEIIAKRRSSRVLAKGSEAGEWSFNAWFGDGEDTYAAIVDNPLILHVGFGISFVRNPADKTYHAYPVARFSRTD